MALAMVIERDGVRCVAGQVNDNGKGTPEKEGA